ncbi:MAG TPA: site-specific integrase [Acidimicrobiia bacterium]|jgi:integrase|nr:site-specific integrase [Acidimicrobiia bacterium]
MAQRPNDPLVAEFLDDTDWTPHVKANAVSTFNRFVVWCAARPVELLKVARPDCRAFLDSRRDQVAASTLRTDWRMLKAFYGWLATPVADGGGGEITRDPMAGVKGPKLAGRPSTTAARPDDVATIERAFPGTEAGRRNAAMVSLMFRSGMRVGELAPLDLEHYQVRPDGHALLFIPTTKTLEPRWVPVHPETHRYIERYLRRRGRAAGPLFRGAGDRTKAIDGRLTTRAIQLVVTRITRRLGVKLSPHQLRRAFTAEYLRAGGDVVSLEIIGGWADHRMPRRYLADEEAAAAVDRYFDVIDNPRARRTA